MTAIIPNSFAPIVRNDGIAEQTMQAWMLSVTEQLKLLEVVEGAGSPEGVLKSPKHKVYFNTSGSAGTFYYRKTTNETLNTGWVAIG